MLSVQAGGIRNNFIIGFLYFKVINNFFLLQLNSWLIESNVIISKKYLSFDSGISLWEDGFVSEWFNYLGLFFFFKDSAYEVSIYLFMKINSRPWLFCSFRAILWPLIPQDLSSKNVGLFWFFLRIHTNNLSICKMRLPYSSLCSKILSSIFSYFFFLNQRNTHKAMRKYQTNFLKMYQKFNQM